MSNKSPMTIGELKATLKRKPQDMQVRYDFVYFYPAGVHSYRGYYDQPAMGYDSEGDEPTVADVLAMLERLTSEMFYGYKGGEYHYRDEQTLWVANSNEAGGTAVVDVVDGDLYVRLKTAVID